MYISYLNLFSGFPDLFHIFSGKCHRHFKLIVSEIALLLLPFFKSSLLEFPISVTSIQFLLPET